MAHPRVDQLRFARSEWQRGLVALSEADAAVRLMPMNSISWMLGHLAWHERLCWMRRARGLRVEPILDAFASGKPATTPSLAEMQAVWARVVSSGDEFLDGLTTADLERPLAHDRRADPPVAGTRLQYITYHYWAHVGEASAVRQMLGHTNLPEYVGTMPSQAHYRRDD
ncbi:MAG: DinB family protein [Candidatus Limnocylindrales bacterium]|nr:DinB family protein [Candidatus Limnocylindrales bacterium]